MNRAAYITDKDLMSMPALRESNCLHVTHFRAQTHSAERCIVVRLRSSQSTQGLRLRSYSTRTPTTAIRTDGKKNEKKKNVHGNSLFVLTGAAKDVQHVLNRACTTFFRPCVSRDIIFPVFYYHHLSEQQQKTKTNGRGNADRCCPVSNI